MSSAAAQAGSRRSERAPTHASPAPCPQYTKSARAASAAASSRAGGPGAPALPCAPGARARCVRARGRPLRRRVTAGMLERSQTSVPPCMADVKTPPQNRSA